MRVEILIDTFVRGIPVRKGQEVEVSDDQARLLCSFRLAKIKIPELPEEIKDNNPAEEILIPDRDVPVKRGRKPKKWA